MRICLLNMDEHVDFPVPGEISDDVFWVVCSLWVETLVCLTPELGSNEVGLSHKKRARLKFEDAKKGKNCQVRRCKARSEMNIGSWNWKGGRVCHTSCDNFWLPLQAVHFGLGLSHKPRPQLPGRAPQSTEFLVDGWTMFISYMRSNIGIRIAMTGGFKFKSFIFLFNNAIPCQYGLVVRAETTRFSPDFRSACLLSGRSEAPQSWGTV